MTAQELAAALGGKREGNEFRCSCPRHGGRSLCVRDWDGRLLLICRGGCAQGEVIAELKRLGLWWNTDHEYHLPAPEPPNDTERKADRASNLWNEARSITHLDPVHTYLKNRGIVLPKYPGDLRCHHSLAYWTVDDCGKPVKTGVFPCMLAVVRSPQGHPVGLHRTYIRSDGSGKSDVPSPKKLYKVRDLTGSAVRLFPPREDGCLAVCEGIEDALSAWILWGIPAWAVLGTSGMRSFVPTAELQEVLILADRDENGAGQKSALVLAGRLEDKGKAVRIRIPSGQKDINALLMKGATHAVYH